MENQKIMPFYMTYPYPVFFEEQDHILRDLTYMEQLFPNDAKKVLEKVVRRLQPMDYEGSILYDEFPDRHGIYRIATSILLEMKEEYEKKGESISKEKELYLQDMVKLVLYHEILKRRCQRNYLWNKENMPPNTLHNGYIRF